MKKFTRKFLSVLLTLAMVITMVPAFSITASATGNVCKIDNTEYATVKAALDAVSDGNETTIVMISDSNENVTVESGKNVTLDLNGYVLKGTGNGSVISNYANLTVKDSNAGNQTHYFIYHSSDKWELKEDASDDEKNVATKLAEVTTSTTDGTLVSVTGGCITGGIGTNGGGVFINANCNFTMSGGNICGNSANQGGALYTGSGTTVKLTDVTITGNTATQQFGGVLLNANGGKKFTIGGAIKIYNNTLIGKADNLNIWDATSAPLEIDSQNPLKTGADINLSLYKNSSQTTGEITINSDDYSKYFTSDNPEYSIIYKDSKVQLSTVAASITKNNTTLYYDKLSDAVNEAEKDDTIVMLRNITEHVSVNSEKTIILDLNGHTLNLNQKNIVTSGDLTIKDSSSGKTGKITNGNATYSGAEYSGDGGAILVVKDSGSASLTLESGTIENCQAKDGGAVFVGEGADFTMKGGTIKNCKATNGGGAVSNYKGTVNIAGIIDSCSASECGGGIYNDGTVTVAAGADIKNCSVNGGDNTDLLGGGIFNNGILTMAGGIIENCSAEKGAGVHNNGTDGVIFTMNGGEIKNNTAERNDGGKSTGGGVQVSAGSTFIMLGGTVTGNKLNATTQLGAGVYNKGTMTAGGSATIRGNTLSDSTTANNLYLSDGTIVTVSTTLVPVSGDNGMLIGVTVNTEPTVGSPVSITGNNTADYSSYFKSDQNNYNVYNSGTGENQTVILSVHEHKWNYAVDSNDSATLKAWCGEDFGKDANCTSYNGESNADTLTIKKPLHETYGDNKETAATLTDASGSPKTTLGGLTTLPEIQYQKKTGENTWGEATTSAPSDAGTYKASITVGSGENAKTAFVEYTIGAAKPDADKVPATPTVKSRTDTKIVINAVTVADETVEYAISKTNSAPESGWQEGTEFTELTANTTYYIFARSKAKENYTASDACEPVEVRTANAESDEHSSIADFLDVTPGLYFYNAVYWALNKGITSGIDLLHFSPNSSCTRAQMVTFLWRAAGSPDLIIIKNPFLDVSSDDYYYTAVLWAVQKGVVKGTSATTFSPNESVKRCQAVTFLARMNGVKDSDTGYSHSFLDVGKSEYYSNAVAWAASKGITSGTTTTLFSPEGDCLRCQIVTFLYRCFN